MNHLGDTNKMVGEDHIRDATKMVSDTPRTDAKRGFHDLDTAVDAEFSEQLECELNASNDRIKWLDEENNELRAEEARLLNTKGELERRIKRFMDAGDAMFPWSERVGQEFWNKAKEDKL